MFFLNNLFLVQADADIIKKNQLVNDQAYEGFRRSVIDSFGKVYDAAANTLFRFIICKEYYVYISIF